ncbi:MAG: cell division protein FtsA [Brevundimonas sp.]|uniref:cell division protein FtsA n=1 Tax=Brevundimonas sp. TaxID=1871086 RepID=UPI0025C485FA|nr:cell division protein FtsA [Brevundimonas sp.]MBX3477571.1 cell division protein FtsA [Brevundimonas sp.]
MAGRVGDNPKTAALGAARAPVVAALDLGHSKVSCFIMKPDGVRHADRTIRVAGASHVQAKGIKGGAIVNMDEAAGAIGHAVERAERAAGAAVSGVIVTTPIGQMASHRIRAEVSLGARPIDDADLARAIGLALARLKLPNRRPIHVLPVAWSVDGARGVRDPRAMRGGALGLDLLVVSMAESVFGALSHCLELAHLDLQGVVSAPVVSSLAALEEDEMDLGCVCIDMGGGATTAAVWRDRSLIHVESVGVGGDHITSDIACALSTSRSGAERLKTLHGSAMASANEDREMLEAPPRGEDPSAGPVVVPRAMLKTIISARVEETLELLRDRLREKGALIDPGAGVVLTGGGSQLTGVRELAVRIFDRPVRLGRPQRAPHLADAASGPAFCASAGVLLRAAYGPREAVSARKLMSRQIGAADAPRVHRGNLVARAAGWLRDNL